LLFVVVMTVIHRTATSPLDQAALVTMESDGGMMSLEEVAAPSQEGGLAPPPGAEESQAPKAAANAPAAAAVQQDQAPAEREPTPMWFWIMLGIGLTIGAIFYYSLTMARLEIFKMLLGSFFPLAVLILFVLGTIVFG